MRKVFVRELYHLMDKDINIFVLLGDLGFGLFDEIRQAFPDRCVNFGASEQLMVGAAAGMAMQGKIPICYSITPFLLYRPFEFIRNYMHIERIPIKLVGSGRDTDYDRAGYTHHATEVQKILNELGNIATYYPEENSPLEGIVKDFVYKQNPAFLSLKK